MNKIMNEKLCRSFKNRACKKLLDSQQKVLQHVLDSMQWENVTEIDFFKTVQNSLKIPIHLIDVAEDDKRKLDTYQYFRLESNKWELSNIDDIINFKSLIIMYKLEQNYEIFDIFTDKDLLDIRIFNFTLQRRLFLVEIGIHLLMKNLKSLRIRFMYEYLNQVLVSNSYDKTLYQVLHETGRNEAIEFLLKNECIFPQNSNEQQIPLIKNQLKSNEEFHELIKVGNLEAIDNFLKANPNQRYFNNKRNTSICAMAIDMKKFDLFSFLYRKGLSFRIYEFYKRDDEDFFNFFQVKTFAGLDLHNKLQILESKTYTINKLATDLSIGEIYKELRKIPTVNLILNILNKILFLLIHIDYQESNSRICCHKFKTNNIYGFFDKIFVSGRGGLKQLLGTFAHQITHSVMNLCYNNLGRPYNSNDVKNQNRFNEIVQNIRQQISNGSVNEELIKSVYEYSDDELHSELVSRVNQVFAFYGHDTGKQILQQQTPELLTFYEIYVRPDLEKYLRGHFNHNFNIFRTMFHRCMERCNKYFYNSNNLSKFTVADYPKNVMIKSDCVDLTCLKIFQNITRCNYNYILNIDNTYFIDLETFSRRNYEIVSHLPKCELLILYDTSKEPLISNDLRNISPYINTVGKRFIIITDVEKKWSFDSAVTFTDSFEFTDIVGISEKLVFDAIKVNFQGRALKLNKLISFEENFHILPKPFSVEILSNYIFGPSLVRVGFVHSNISTYVNRTFITTIFELDELRDEIFAKYLCENITDESGENHFELRTRNGQLIKFPGKTLRIKDYKPLSEPIASTSNKKVHDDMENEIFILSLKSSESFIIIDEEKEIEINNFSYADMETFSKNNNKFNIHWFVESDNSQHFFHHLKTFGSFDKTRSFCYREKTTIDEENLLKKLKNQKVFLIAAPAGMGKTETIKNMAAHLVENDSSMWTPVIVLRQCAEILKTFRPKNSDPECSDQDYLFDFLRDLLKLRSKFEKEMFTFWCKKKPNNICLFLDGVDENGPEFTDITIDLVKRLSQTNIKYIIVSVRLMGKFEFEFKLDTVAIEIEPLSFNDQTECLTNIWEYEKITNTVKIARRVAKHFRDFGDFLNNPLQIVLVTKICKDKLNEFSKNLINIYFFFKDGLSLIEMFEKFIKNKLLKTFYEKSSKWLPIESECDAYVRKTQHQLLYAAIRVLLNENDVKLFLTLEEIELHKNFIGNIKNWEDFEGIVDGVFSGKLHFVHRTYAEYYFADFLLNHYNVWNKNTEQFFFEHILVKNEFEYVRKFFNSYKGTSDLLSRKPKHFEVPVTLHDAVLQNIEENNREILQYLHSVRFNITINPSTLITKYIYNNSPNSIEKLIETIKYLISKCGIVHLSIKELGTMNIKILRRILPADCIELLKALLQCDLIDDLSDGELFEDETKTFLSLWNEAKTKVMADHEDNEPKKLLELFEEIVQIININR